MRQTRRPTAAVTLLVLTVGVTGCGSDPDPAEAAPADAATVATQPSAAASADEAVDPAETADAAEPTGTADVVAAELPVVPAEAGHLHGIGVDPADGRVLLGTHVGLMAVGTDGVERVGEATTDLMGFAVAGPQHYYASGHPGPGEDLPNPVGLLETTDGGLTWRVLSRAGESDFHTLAGGDGRVYGFDGVLRSSADGVSWDDGAGDVAPVSMAVRPDDANTLVGTTQQGPVRSEDGGASFDLLDGAPLLVFVAWPDPDGLWGVDTEGRVHVSDDGGTSWAPRGEAGGPPEAFTASAGGDVLVATGEHIARSADGGRTFEAIALRD